MEEVVQMLSESIMKEEIVMPVRRGHVLEDAIRTIRRSLFNPQHTLVVCFWIDILTGYIFIVHAWL